MRALPLALIVWLAAVLPANAQIYTWRDPSGHLVLSNKPQSGSEPPQTYAVQGSTTLRTAGSRTTGRDTSAYEDLIRQHAEQHGISADLVRAVIQAESGFNPRAVSSKGAKGLMQLMPATARDFGVLDPFHPGENIRAGVAYLARLLARFDQNVERALAAYNAGPERVERYNGVPPYRETRDYVKKITGAAQAPPPAAPVIYKWIELVDGQPRTRYSNIPPRDSAFEIVGKR